ncbi:hypothetical protein BLNAU_14483 [Blattamonas nauphoetae]|uniref:Uncharacterized protein n=1 Tax=Blattamonas nauphoetae TaxID=2049346 RepID=A0ABQ9XK08_9EUKA|nr:hypothetical protein BLNAU_14483 [Blattamonas nauphoetae]
MLETGSISHSDDCLDSNTSWGENDEISMIIDMTRHCLYFQNNGELQPIGVRNIPHSLRFAFDLYWENDTCEVLSLEYLTEPAFQKLMKLQKVTLKDWR